MFQRLLTTALTLVAGALITLAILWHIPAADAAPLTGVTTTQAPAVVQESVAAAPMINYQGRLLDPLSGQAKPDGSYTMAFRLYTVAAGGSALWTESKSVTVNKGLFSTLLGDTTALDLTLFNGQELYLGITVGSDPETAPRQRIAHTAYAIYAERANLANNAAHFENKTATDFAAANHTHGGDTITDNSLTTADIADAAITTAKLANGAVTADKLAPSALTKFLTLDPYAAFLSGGATFTTGYGPNAGLRLADGANGSFYSGFTIPPNYTSGTTLSVRFLWHTSATNCSFAFLGNAISVARPGRTHITGGSTDTGLTVVGGTRLNAPATSNQTMQTLVNITSPDGVTPLQPGDSIIFSLFRAGNNAVDTCAAEMVIQSISVTYQ